MVTLSSGDVVVGCVLVLVTVNIFRSSMSQTLKYSHLYPISSVTLSDGFTQSCSHNCHNECFPVWDYDIVVGCVSNVINVFLQYLEGNL